MDKFTPPKIGFLQRLRIAFSDKAATERVYAVMAALNGAPACDPTRSETHEWGEWTQRQQWGHKKDGSFFPTLERQKRECKRCKLSEHIDHKL